MMNLDCWKQKIPVSLFEFFGEDHTARLIYQELLMMAAFNDNSSKGKSPQKGQCYFSLATLAKRFRLSRNGVHQVTKRLTLEYGLIKIEVTTKCSICTLLDYNVVTGRIEVKKTPGDTQVTGSGTKYQLTAFNNNTYKQNEPEKEPITASTITEENTPPFQNVPQKVSLAERSELEQELKVLAIKGGKSHRFTKSQLEEIGGLDKASVMVCMRLAVARCRGEQISYPYFKAILQEHGLQKGTVTITERPRITEFDIIRQAEADGYKPRPLPKFPVTEKLYV